LFLPFQILPLLGWNTIPAVAIAAITYLGFLEIGCQIEMPFVSSSLRWHGSRLSEAKNRVQGRVLIRRVMIIPTWIWTSLPSRLLGSWQKSRRSVIRSLHSYDALCVCLK
jgi:hypothetical protein